MLLREGRPAQPVEGELCHHGQGHALRRHPVLLPRTLQNTARRPLRIPGKVSLSLRLDASHHHHHSLALHRA